ncbi:putative reverse transcriptase domain-containing protein, partial [Tanacetum coccineum]
MIDQGVTAILAARDATRNGDDSHTSRTGVRRTERVAQECTYQDFMKCQPLYFKGTEGVVELTQWFERMEIVFTITNCFVDNQIKFSTCTLLAGALTWWNSHVRIVGQDVAYAITWTDLRKKMTDKYCPRNEMKKLEVELWNFKVKGTGVTGYNQRFQELALLCVRMFLEETGKVERSSARVNLGNNQRRNGTGQGPTCFECGVQGYYKRECPKLKNNNNNNRGNQAGNTNAPAKVYAVGHAGTNPDSNVMMDFLDVFPEDLPGLPRTRQLEFQIDLVPGAAPVARAPYRWAPSEMKELSEQLQELSDKELLSTSKPPIAQPRQRRVLCPCGDGATEVLRIQEKVTARRAIYHYDRCQVEVCKPYLDKFIIVFIDDILIYSKNKQEHEEHLKLILELLKKEELYVKFSKSEFWIPKVQFLGHVIDSKGIHVDPAKIESIKDWASPKSPTEIRQFLYYRRFIEGFFKIAKPMTKLTQKKVKFEWGDKQETSFQLLKQKLCSAQILALPKGSKDFIVYCDASKKGLGAVLMQREKVIAYASRQLKIHEKT